MTSGSGIEYGGFVIEYGGFVFDRKSGKEMQLFVTTFSERLCRNRTEETAIRRNKDTDSDFDLNTLKVKYRVAVSGTGSWRETEMEARDDGETVKKLESQASSGCAGCVYLDKECAPCANCVRSVKHADYYRREI